MTALPELFDPDPPADQKAKSRRGFSPRQRAARRLNEMDKLAEFRRSARLPLGSWRAWVKVTAHCLLCRGLDATADELSEECPVPIPDFSAAAKIVAKLVQSRDRKDFTGFNVDDVGALLAAKSDEVDALGLRTIMPCDETRNARRVRLEEERNARRRQRYEEGKPTEVLNRDAWLEKNSVSAKKPWEAEGISRRTWYRRNGGTGSRQHIGDLSGRAPVPIGSGNVAILFQNAAQKLRRPLDHHDQGRAISARPAARRATK